MNNKTIALLSVSVLALALSAGSVFAEAAVESEEAVLETEVQEEAPSEDSLTGLISSAFGEGGKLSDLLAEDGVVLGENGLISSLFGEGGMLSEVVPEGVDVEQLAKSAAEQLQDQNSELYKGIEEIEGIVSNEDGSLNLEKIGGLAEMFLSNVTAGSEEGSEAAPGDMLIFDDQMKETIKAYVNEFYSDLVNGEFSVIGSYSIKVTPTEDGNINILGEFTKLNYAVEGTELKETGSASQPMFFTLSKKEDGSYEIVDFKTTEDGEGFTASLEELCKQVGLTVEEYLADAGFSEIAVLDELVTFLEEHPEFQKLEYNGELVTKEELEDTLGTVIESLFTVLAATVPEEAEAAEVTSEAAEVTSEAPQE